MTLGYSKTSQKSKKGNDIAFSTLIKNYEKDLYRVAIAITKKMKMH